MGEKLLKRQTNKKSLILRDLIKNIIQAIIKMHKTF